MPFVHLKTTARVDADTVRELASDLTGLMVGILRKRAELTSVLIEAGVDGYWTVGSQSVAFSAELEATVTAGTNTESEKENFIAQAMASIRRHIPKLAPIVYVVVREIAGTDWGYDGKTQAARQAVSRTDRGLPSPQAI
jgi:4-oxalocrotonate tautomerase